MRLHRLVRRVERKFLLVLMPNVELERCRRNLREELGLKDNVFLECLLIRKNRLDDGLVLPLLGKGCLSSVRRDPRCTVSLKLVGGGL